MYSYTDQAGFTQEGVFNVHNNREALGQIPSTIRKLAQVSTVVVGILNIYCKPRWTIFLFGATKNLKLFLFGFAIKCVNSK
jgi:hypothetical protein